MDVFALVIPILIAYLFIGGLTYAFIDVNLATCLLLWPIAMIIYAVYGLYEMVVELNERRFK